MRSHRSEMAPQATRLTKYMGTLPNRRVSESEARLTWRSRCLFGMPPHRAAEALRVAGSATSYHPTRMQPSPQHLHDRLPRQSDTAATLPLGCYALVTNVSSTGSSTLALPLPRRVKFGSFFRLGSRSLHVQGERPKLCDMKSRESHG